MDNDVWETLPTWEDLDRENKALLVAEDAAIAADPVLANTENYVITHAGGKPGDLAGEREWRWNRIAQQMRASGDLPTNDTAPIRVPLRYRLRCVWLRIKAWFVTVPPVDEDTQPTDELGLFTDK